MEQNLHRSTGCRNWATTPWRLNTLHCLLCRRVSDDPHNRQQHKQRYSWIFVCLCVHPVISPFKFPVPHVTVWKACLPSDILRGPPHLEQDPPFLLDLRRAVSCHLKSGSGSSYLFVDGAKACYRLQQANEAAAIFTAQATGVGLSCYCSRSFILVTWWLPLPNTPRCVSFMSRMSPQLFLIHTTYVWSRFNSVTKPALSLLWFGCMDALLLLPATWRHWFTDCRNALEECANVHLKTLKLCLKLPAWLGGWTEIQASELTIIGSL